MMFFKVLSIVVGAVMVLKGPAAALLGEGWTRLELKAVYPQKRPFWVYLAAVGVLVLVAVTWRFQVRRPVPWSWVVTLVVTLGVFKTSQVLFNYGRSSEFEHKLLARSPRLVAVVNVALAVVGIALILLGVFVYP